MKCTHLGKQYDSVTEACMAAWLYEASALGLVFDYKEQECYELAPRKTKIVVTQLKTKTKHVERALLQAAEYTADFVVYVSNYSVCRRFEEVGLLPVGIGGYDNMYSDNARAVFVIDVKGERSPHAPAAKFSLTQKFLHASTGIYCNKLVPCARKPKAKAKSFFMLCGLPSELPQECYRKDGAGFVQPWKDMFEGCPGIEETLV